MRREELDRSPAYQLWLVSNAWQRILRKALAPYGLTHVQFTLLAATDLIRGEEKSVTQRHICRFAEIDENMTSQVVKSLIEKRLITRSPNPEDARAYRIELTEEGARLLADARASMKGAKEAFFAPVAGREAELVEMLRMLHNNASCPEE